MSEGVRHVDGAEKPFEPRFGQLGIELTERCNNNCVHCCINLPENDVEVQQRELTAAQIKDILKQAADRGFLQVLLTGGEPLLRPDFEEIYLFARRLGMKVMLFTNGRLITPHLTDLFARIPPLEPIEITVYGMHRESYEAVTRSPGSFAQFWRGVNLLLECGVPLYVKSALLPQNRADMKEFEAWAKNIPGMSGRPTYSMFYDLRVRRDDADKNSLIKSLRPSPQEGLAVYLRDEIKYHKWTQELAAKLLHPRGDRLFDCGICEGRSVCVDAYGRVQPCMGIRAPELTCDIGAANVPSSLRDALDRFTRLRDRRAIDPDYLRRCAVCFLKGLCEQCPAKSWAENGSLDAPVEYLCEVTHAVARYLGWLHVHEHSWEVHDWLVRIT